MPSEDVLHAHDRRIPSSLALERDDAFLLVIDVQERLLAAMPEAGREALLKNVEVLLRMASRLSLPVVTTEQYPRGLGHTAPRLRELLAEPPFEKLEFSCGASRPVAQRIFETGRKQAIVAGMEAHVCVFQTVRDLRRGDFAVFLPQDAVLSRTEANRQTGLRLAEKAGCTLTSTETVLFDLLGTAGTPEFKELSPLIK